MAKAKREKPLSERLEEAASRLWCACECDGRGCVVCDAIDLMTQATRKLEKLEEL